MVRYTPINVTFKGTKTINEIYKIHLNDIKQTLEMVDDIEKLREIELELKSCVATAYNKRAVLMGYTLRPAIPETKLEVW